MQQLSLFDQIEKEPCLHSNGYVTHACVPAGLWCSDCNRLVCQSIPQPPEVIGYTSADWTWKHEQGKECTTL